jgi:hypothetical protein
MLLLVVETFLALLVPLLTAGAWLSDIWRARKAARARSRGSVSRPEPRR